MGFNDTIAAIATPVGVSGIGIVRMSGQGALKIADKVFQAKDGRKPSSFKSYTVHYGWIADASRQIIDEVILTVMRAPRSYTKEDVVEINCHGGIVALRRVLDLVLENNARLADPGEFTKRAFLNGRLDLAQAEAVIDIIRAKTGSSLKISQEQLKGNLSQLISKLSSGLLDMLSVLEANIDFPEEEISPANLKEMRIKLGAINRQLLSLLESAKYGRVLREGIHAVICGRPNVGKSSLLNALLKQERSIVTAVPGTTRDTIEEIIDIRGIPIRIVDTAGILEPRDLIEKKAVARSKKQIGLADLVILLFDGSQPLHNNDLRLMQRLNKKIVLAVINKCDLRQKIERQKLRKSFSSLIEISAKKNKNINLLEDAIAGIVYSGSLKSPESAIISNARHIQAVKKAQKLIAEALVSLDNLLSIEFIAQDLREAIGFLDDILGKRFSEDLLDKIFRDFCIGK